LIENFSNYDFQVVTHLGAEGVVDDLHGILRYMIPCNLTFDILNVLNVIAEGSAATGATVVTTTTYLVTNEFDEVIP